VTDSRQPLRVAHMVTAFPRHDGDVITPWLGELLLAQVERGIRVSVWAPAYKGGGDGRWRGIPVRRFRYAPAAWETLTHDETAPDRLRSKPWYAVLLPGFALGGLVAAWRIARAGVDVVHVHWPMPNGLFGAAARWFSGGKIGVVSSFYSVEIRWVVSRVRVLVPFLKWTIRSADILTANSSATAEQARRLGAAGVRVIPSPAGIRIPGPAEILPGHAPAPARPSRDRDPAGRAEILFVGRLVQRKGVETLVRAVAKLARKRPVRLTVVGEGSWRPRIEAAVAGAGAENSVRFAGRVGERELHEAYRRADVFVLPAVYDDKGDTEGLGVVLIEALSHEVPVVGADIGGIPDIVIDGETGWLFPSGDADRLAEVIELVLDDPVEAARRVSRGISHARKRFSASGIAGALECCYRDAMC